MNHRSRYRASRQLMTWRKRRRQGIRRLFIIGLLAIVLLPAMTVPALAAQSVGTLPSVDKMSTNNLYQDTIIYDRNGVELADLGYQGDHRIVVPLSQISPYVLKATVAIEDRTFWKNNGIDVASIFRAAASDFRNHHIDQGGSTITQQLVKQVFIGAHPALTLQRKMREAILALEVASRYSKDQVLGMYLNTIYYGSQAYGIEAAARSYFHVSSSKLDLAQASMLAGLPQAPTANSPLLNPGQSKIRQAQVLQAMVAQRLITRAQAEAALKERVAVYPPANPIKAPDFVNYVLGYMQSQLGISPSDHRGYRVYTTLNWHLQQMAQSIVNQRVAAEGNYYNFHDGALVAIDPRNGQVVAMVGGTNSNANGGKINMAVHPRQPGSSFKIYTYTAAIDSRKINMNSPILDSPLVFPIFGGTDGFARYRPLNYDFRWHGVVPARLALGNSLNIPALKVEMYTGIPAVVDMARAMGVTSLTDPNDNYGLSLTLGGYPVSPLDMATGAATLADLGIRHRPAPILRVDNGLGQQIYNYDPSTNEFRAVDQQTAYIMGEILSNDANRCMEFGCGGDLTLPGRQVAAKTGTTQNFKDNWTIGYTPTLATAVWVGNPDNVPLYNSTGIVGAAPIWHQFMMQALAKVPNLWYQMPAGVDQIGNSYYLPGTENLPNFLAHSWPRCDLPYGYDPYTLTASQITVDGVYCVLN